MTPFTQEVIRLTPKLVDPYGTCYLSITELGYCDTIGREELETPAQLSAWFGQNYQFGTDFGPGTEHAGTGKLLAHLEALRGGAIPIDPVDPVDPEPPLKATYDWPTAVIRAESGIGYRGTVGCERAELASRKESLAVGTLPQEWEDFQADVPRWALLSNFVSTFKNTSSQFRDEYGVPMTGQAILDREKLVSGYNPSGGG